MDYINSTTAMNLHARKGLPPFMFGTEQQNARLKRQMAQVQVDLPSVGSIVLVGSFTMRKSINPTLDQKSRLACARGPLPLHTIMMSPNTYFEAAYQTKN